MGGTHRNAASLADAFEGLTDRDTALLCDPQTSGGLLVCVAEPDRASFEEKAREHGLALQPFGRLHERGSDGYWVQVIG